MKNSSSFTGSAFVLCIALLVCQAVSCNLFFDGQEPADETVKEAINSSIVVKFASGGLFSRSGSPRFSEAPIQPGAAVRTVVPQTDLEITSITVTVTHSGGTATGSVGSATESCIIENISPGPVSVQAVARNAAAAQVASGSDSGSVSEGQSLALTIALVPKVTPITGTGHFAFAMRWPESTGAAFVECSLKDSLGVVSNTQNTTEEPSGGSYAWTYAGTGVASGAYDLAVTFKASAVGTVLGGFMESVNIYDNLTSDTWLDANGNHLSSRTFTANELKDSLTELLRLVITGSGFSNVYPSPAKNPAPAIALNRTASPTIGFTAELIAPGAGQSITWVLTDLSGPSASRRERWVRADPRAGSRLPRDGGQLTCNNRHIIERGYGGLHGDRRESIFPLLRQ